MGRFALSPHIPDLAMIAFLLLIPTVWIVAARGGRLTSGWKKAVRIGIPANVALMAVILVALFAGRDLGAMTERVTVLDTMRSLDAVQADVEALAAVTLAGNFYFVIFIMGSGFAWAVMPMVAAFAAGTAMPYRLPSEMLNSISRR